MTWKLRIWQQPLHADVQWYTLFLSCEGAADAPLEAG